MIKCYYRIGDRWYIGLLIGSQENGLFKTKKYLVMVEKYNILTNTTYTQQMLFKEKDVIISK